MALTDAERVRAYRDRQRELDRPDSSRQFRKYHRHQEKIVKKFNQTPFMGCDGEGCGTDDKGRQNYMLLRIGDRDLFTGNPLSTVECLDFICDSPSDTILVGFAFGYDVTMILRDLSTRQKQRLFEPHVFGEGHSPFVWFKSFDIDYLPKNYLRVRRVEVQRFPDGSEKRVPVKGSTRTIYETFGFFQKSFLKTLESFDVGSIEQRRAIAIQKDRRESFVSITQVERDYCALECQFLAELMEKLREYCLAVGIKPHTWAGAGKLASAMHRMYETPKRKLWNTVIPKEVDQFANMAYYGGRFEITRSGLIRDKIYEYDIRSAYPDAMRKLPCLLHGRFERFEKEEVNEDQLYIGACHFKSHSRGQFGALGGLPIRSKEGNLYWPNQGSGVYWSPEIASARKLGFQVRLNGGYRYVSGNCHCPTFRWVKNLYDYRRSIGSSGVGYPLKLGINALYGQIVMRVGNGSFVCMIWGSLITALTRAKLNEAIALAPGQIIMLATDAVYSLVPLPGLTVSEELGDWDYQELDGLFIVQPGLYWSPEKRKRKSRGLSGKFFETPGFTERFEAEWHDFHAKELAGQTEMQFPSVPVPVPGFIGLKLALSRGKPDLAGTWVKETRDISFDYRNKRQGHRWNGDHIVTKIKAGFPGLQSLPHRDFLKAGGAEPWERARLMLEEQPDFVDLSSPYE